jgi:sulfate adenylyltransferase
MSKLVAPHGGKGLVICKLEGADLEAEKQKQQVLKKLKFHPR